MVLESFYIKGILLTVAKAISCLMPWLPDQLPDQLPDAFSCLMQSAVLIVTLLLISRPYNHMVRHENINTLDVLNIQCDLSREQLWKAFTNSLVAYERDTKDVELFNTTRRYIASRIC